MSNLTFDQKRIFARAIVFRIGNRPFYLSEFKKAVSALSADYASFSDKKYREYLNNHVALESRKVGSKKQYQVKKMSPERISTILGDEKVFNTRSELSNGILTGESFWNDIIMNDLYSYDRFLTLIGSYGIKYLISVTNHRIVSVSMSDIDRHLMIYPRAK